MNYTGGLVTNASDIFHLHGNISVACGASLTINESYSLLFDDGVFLRVNGTLVAAGSPQERITFGSNSTHAPGAWRGIMFDTGGGTSYLNHTTIYNAETPIYCNNSRLELHGVTVNHSSEAGIALFNASSLLADNVSITNCTHGISAVGNGDTGWAVEMNDTVITNISKNAIAVQGDSKGSLILKNASMVRCQSAINIRDIPRPVISRVDITDVPQNPLSVENASGLTVDDLTMDNCSSGIVLTLCNDTVLDNITINGSGPAVTIRSSLNVSLCEIVITNGSSGVKLENCSETLIAGLTVSGGTGCGLSLSGGNNLSMTGLDLDAGDCGFHVDNVTGVLLTEAAVDSVTGDGIDIGDSLNVSLSDVSVTGAQGDGIEVVRSSFVSWSGVTLDGCGVGLNVTDVQWVNVSGAGLLCTGNSEVYYKLTNVGKTNVADLDATNAGGIGFWLEKVARGWFRNVTLSTPGKEPIVIKSRYHDDSRVYVNESSFSTFKGGVKVIGNRTVATQLRITNSTFENYGLEYINVSHSDVILLNSTFVKDHIVMDQSRVRIEYFLSVTVFNITGVNLSNPSVKVEDRNGSGYEQWFYGESGNIMRWMNVTFVDMNGSGQNESNYPLNVTVMMGGYTAPSQELSTLTNSELVFHMNDTSPPDTMLTVDGSNYTDTKNNLFITDISAINLSAEDWQGCGVKLTKYRLRWEGNDSPIWMNYTTPFRPGDQNGEGNYTLDYYSIDYENNTEPERNQSIVVDASAPDFIEIEIIDGYRGNLSDVLNISRRTIFILNFNDTSGIDHYWLSVDGNYTEWVDFIINIPDEYDREGGYNISFGAVDNLGHNVTGIEFSVILDTEEPRINETITDYIIIEEEGIDYLFVSRSTNITLKATDNYSGVKRLFYEIDWVERDYNGTIECRNLGEGQHQLRIGAEDNLGNSNWAVLTRPSVLHLDVTAPTVTLILSGENHVLTGTEDVYVRKSTVFRLSAEDISGNRKQCGTEGIWYSLDGNFHWADSGHFSDLAEGEHFFRYGAIDKLGNNRTQDGVTLIVTESSPSPPIVILSTNRTRYEHVLVSGKAPIDSTVNITVNFDFNDSFMATPDETGNFSVYILLEPGENTVSGYTRDFFGRYSVPSAPLTVYLDEQKPSVVRTVPERNSTDVPVDTSILIYLTEPVRTDCLSMDLTYYDEDALSWEMVEGNLIYREWSLLVTFVPGTLLRYETDYRIELQLMDHAQNYQGVRLYSGDKPTFTTEKTVHDYNQKEFKDGGLRYDVEYNKLGDSMDRYDLFRFIRDVEFTARYPPPRDNLTPANSYFNLTFNDDFIWVKLTLTYVISELEKYYNNTELWDYRNLSFYELRDGVWSRLDTTRLTRSHTIQYFCNNPGDKVITMGVFATSFDWDRDKVPNDRDEFPRDVQEWMDSDGDGVGDNSDPYPENPVFRADDDDDEIPNEWEYLFGLQPFDDRDGEADLDGDGLSNLDEFLNGTLPNHWDTDGDGMPDGWEVEYGLDPLNATDADGDLDDDGKSNLDEYTRGTHPGKEEIGNSVESGEEPGSPLVLIIVVVTILALLALLGYYFHRKRKKEGKGDEEVYFDLEDLGSADYPGEMEWGDTAEPIEVFDMDYFDDELGLKTISFEDIDRELDRSYLHRELNFDRYENLIDDRDVLKVILLTCSNCGAEVEEDDDECKRCKYTFEGEPELEDGLDEEEARELGDNLNIYNCSKCGEVVRVGDDSCEGCGAVFLEENESQCSRCNRVVKSDADECPHCKAVFEQ